MINESYNFKVSKLVSDGKSIYFSNNKDEFYIKIEDIELYFCGPPLMNQAVQKMGEDFGMPDENIRFDDFGG